MKCDKQHMLLYAVTDRAWTGKQTLYEQVEAALKGGVTCVQLREKELDETAFLQEAKELCALCRRYGVPFLVNDNVEIAIACGADGIHVGQEDLAAGEVRRRVGENMILGVSVHTVEEACQAVRDGADYLGLGAVFPTDRCGADVQRNLAGDLRRGGCAHCGHRRHQPGQYSQAGRQRRGRRGSGVGHLLGGGH